MPLDLSGVDAELDALGNAPEHAVALARDLAGVEIALDQLPAIDRELGLLETGIAALSPGSNGIAQVASESLDPERRRDSARPEGRLARDSAHVDDGLARDSAHIDDGPARDSAHVDDGLARDSAPVDDGLARDSAPSDGALARGSAPDDGGLARQSARSAAPAAQQEPDFALEAEQEPRPARDMPLESGPAPAGQSVPALRASADPAGVESWPPIAQSGPPEAAAQDDSPPSAVHSMPPPPLTQSQEIVLPDPIPREELSSESGELRLDDDKPSSGSFSLDEAPPDSGAFTARDPDAATSEPPARPRLSQFVTDDVGDALEGSQPLSLGSAKLGGSKAPPFAFDRDPDAEFDALLSEATDPNGIPTDAPEADVDELLQGLREEELEDEHADLATTEFNPDASAETEVHDAADELALLMLDEPEEATEVVDRAVLGALMADTPASGAPQSAAKAAVEAAAPAQEDTLTELGELEMGELEIVMDEAPTKAPPPPPPRPSANPEKRPSSGFLGRIFGRGERE